MALTARTISRIRAAGGDPSRARRCALSRGYLKAFIELHIEQGPVLDLRRIPIGVVDVIAGRRWGEVVFEGVTAHSGGQPMRLRKDAALAAASLMLEADAAARTEPSCAPPAHHDNAGGVGGPDKRAAVEHERPAGID